MAILPVNQTAGQGSQVSTSSNTPTSASGTRVDVSGPNVIDAQFEALRNAPYQRNTTTTTSTTSTTTTSTTTTTTTTTETTTTTTTSTTTETTTTTTDTTTTT